MAKEDLERIENALSNTAEELTQEQQAYRQAYSELLKSQSIINSLVDSVIEDDIPILTIDDVHFLWQGSITVIKGGIGQHKSRLAETMIFRLLEAGKKIYLFDSERRMTKDLPRIKANMKRYTKNWENLRILSFQNVPRQFRKKALIEYMEENSGDVSNSIIIIDILLDVMNDSNSLSESNILFDVLNSTMNVYNFSIVVVIHVGQTGKALGHGGSEFERKCSVLIHTKSRGDGILELKFQKLRWQAPVAQMLMTVDPTTKLLDVTNQVTPNEIIEEILIESLVNDSELKPKDIYDALNSELDITERQARRIFDNYCKKSILMYGNVKYKISITGSTHKRKISITKVLENVQTAV